VLAASQATDRQGAWKIAKTNGKYLFPVKAMSKVFRSRFIDELKELLPDQVNKNFINQLYRDSH
jgi:hypothetical protein